MYDTNPPLPSWRTLALSTAAAAGLAAIALVTLVWPAEFGIDPTGVGKLLGLTRLAAAAEGAVRPATGEAGIESVRRDTVQIQVPAKSDLEYKFRLASGAVLEYVWRTDRGVLFAELHGEPTGAPQNYYEDFIVSTSEHVKGSHRAPFDGRHGWYWKNDNDFPVTITLMTSGEYEVIGQLPGTS
jgi:hypothetical protein